MFQRKVWKHLKENGLDTPTYIEDPSAYGHLVSVVSDHGKFTYEDGKAKAKFNLKYFDEYMHSCSKDGIEVLLDSVDDKIHKQLYQSCTDKDPFVTYWLRFIKVINITSTGEFKSMEAKMLERKITDYEGENVEALCTEYLDDWQQLYDANAFDYQCTLDMLQEIMKAGGKDNADFKYELRGLEKKLDKKLLEVRHKIMAEKHSAQV